MLGNMDNIQLELLIFKPYVNVLEMNTVFVFAYYSINVVTSHFENIFT